MNKVILIEKEPLYELYVRQKLSMKATAKKLDVSVGSVFNYLCKYEIPTREQKDGFSFAGKKHSKEALEKISKTHLGKTVSKKTKEKMAKAHTIDRPGHKKINNRGYVMVYFPKHPRCRKDGYISEHTLVAENKIGRPIKKSECVHHVNGDKLDNRPENLIVMDKHEHMSYHSKMRWEAKNNESHNFNRQADS